MWSGLFSAKARLIGTGFAFALRLLVGTAAPSMADEGFSQDLGIVRACAGDVWKLCSDVLPDVVAVLFIALAVSDTVEHIAARRGTKRVSLILANLELRAGHFVEELIEATFGKLAHFAL